MNIDRKHFDKTLASQIHEYIKKRIYRDQVGVHLGSVRLVQH